MGQDPDAIRQEIEHTRERMGDTVGALSYKADVPARAKESIGEKVDTLKSKVTGVRSGMSDRVPEAGELTDGAKRAVGVVEENPLGLAIGAAAAGFLAGMLIPSSRIEDERLGPVADQVKEQAKQTGQEALEHGRQIAQDAASVATQKAQETVAEVRDKAQESGQAHAQEMSDSAKRHAQEMSDSAKRSAEHVQQTAKSEG
jgi:gas vesicle protein